MDTSKNRDTSAGPNQPMVLPYGPPFDGKPCPCFPVEVRGLYACAYNLGRAWRAKDFERAKEHLVDLDEAVRNIQPMIDAHFADRAHSHGDE